MNDIFAAAATQAGWLPKEVRALESVMKQQGGLDVVQPEGPALLHRTHGDSLVDLATGLWPPVPPGAVLSVKYAWPSGRRERTVVSCDDGAYTLHRFQLNRHAKTGTGVWSRRDSPVAGSQLSEVVRATASLRVVRPGRMAQYSVDPSGLSEVQLSQALANLTDFGLRIELGMAFCACWRVALSDEQVEELLLDTDWLHRWASINQYRLSFIKVSSASGGRAIPVLVDEAEPEVVVQREIARYSWFSESGGAPISWDGGASLSLIARGLGLYSVFGDTADNYGAVIPLPTSPALLADTVASWIVGCDAEVASALALEPLDPDSTLSADERERWEAQLSGVTISLDLDVLPQTERRARRALAATSELYARTRDALAHPTGGNGRTLAAVFDRFEEQGITGELISGDWDDAMA